MKSWKVILEFFVYHAKSIDDVRAVLPIITSSHEPMHTDILPKAKITEMTDDQILEHQIDDSVELMSHLINIDRELVKANANEWEMITPNGNKFVWVKNNG